jgi:hypothetical protein
VWSKPGGLYYLADCPCFYQLARLHGRVILKKLAKND